MRTASIKGDTIHITGDWDEETNVEIWAPKKVKQATFNGAKLEVSSSGYGSLIGTLPAPEVTVDSLATQLPPLTKWKVADGLPEVAANYDDSRWTSKSSKFNYCDSLTDL